MEQPKEQEPKKEPQPTDVGTRYEHLMDYKEALEECIEILKNGHATVQNHQRIVKFSIALEVMQSTLDAVSGYRNTEVEFQLYKLLNSIPTTPKGINEIGGIPLDQLSNDSNIQ